MTHRQTVDGLTGRSPRSGGNRRAAAESPIRVSAERSIGIAGGDGDDGLCTVAVLAALAPIQVPTQGLYAPRRCSCCPQWEVEPFTLDTSLSNAVYFRRRRRAIAFATVDVWSFPSCRGKYSLAIWA